MAKRTTKSSLAAKLGKEGRVAVEAHRSDETTYSAGADLPEGIDGGIAQLTECKFDKYKTGNNVGEYYYLASGIVKLPKEVNGVPVEGLRTQVGPHPMCDTPTRKLKTVGEHVAWVLNEFRKLGADVSEAGIDDLESIAAALKEAQPHFRFRTWKGAKATEGEYKDVEPRVQNDWRGACEYEESEEDEGEGVADDTEEPEGEEPDSEGEDLTALGELADTSDEDADALDAQRKLSDLAAEAGFEPDDLPTWSAVAEKLQEDDDDEEEEDDDDEEEEEETEPPEKGEVWKFKPPKKRKAVDCEVTAVFPTKKTCNLKNLEDGKVYKSIPWDKLETEE